MGPTRTVPPDPPATPRTRRQLASDPLKLDQPPATPPEPSMPVERWPLPIAPLDGTSEPLDAVTDLLAPEHLPHRVEIIDSLLQPPQPLGRRTPEALDAAREGVER